MVKTSSTKSAEPRKGVVRVGGGRRARRDRGELNRSGMDDVEVDGGKVEVGKKGRNSFKSKKTELGFFTPKTRKAFTELRQAFIKAPILHYFNPECHI